MLTLISFLIGLAMILAGMWLNLHMFSHGKNVFCNYSYCRAKWVK